MLKTQKKRERKKAKAKEPKPLFKRMNPIRLLREVKALKFGDILMAKYGKKYFEERVQDFEKAYRNFIDPEPELRRRGFTRIGPSVVNYHRRRFYRDLVSKLNGFLYYRLLLEGELCYLNPKRLEELESSNRESRELLEKRKIETRRRFEEELESFKKFLLKNKLKWHPFFLTEGFEAVCERMVLDFAELRDTFGHGDDSLSVAAWYRHYAEAKLFPKAKELQQELMRLESKQ